MNILNRITGKSLRLNRKRTIVTVIGIILSTAMICATISIAVSFQDLFIQQAKKSDGDFHATFLKVEPEQFKYITENAYTETSMFSRNLGFARFEKSTWENRPYLYIKEYDATSLKHMPIQLTSGRYPEKSGEILLSEEALESSQDAYRIGETIALDLGLRRDARGEQLADGFPFDEAEQFVATETRVYEITGIIAKPHFENFSSNPGFTAVAYLDPQALVAGDGANISILAKNPRKIFERVPEMAAGAGGPEYAYNNELLKYLGVTKNERANDMINSLALIVILLIMVGSVTVIYNAFAISVSERKKQFGLLASSGATPGQIRRTVFFEGFFLGMIGIPLGLLAGFGGIGVTLSVVSSLMSGSMFSNEMSLRLVITPLVIPATVAFVALIIFISVYIPARRAAATSPIEAIRLSADIRINRKTLKTSRLTRRLFGVEGELALKNLKRNRRRYKATVFSLFISIVLFVSFSTFINFAFQGSGMYYQDIPFDYSAFAAGVPPENQRALYEEVAVLAGVERCVLYREIVTESRLEREKFGSYLQKNYLDDGPLPEDEEGRYLFYFHLVALGEDEFKYYAAESNLDPGLFESTDNLKGILVNKSQNSGERLAEYEPLKIKQGEKLTLQGPLIDPQDPGISPPEFNLEVAAISENFPLGSSSIGLGAALIVSDKVFEAVQAVMLENSENLRYEDQHSLSLYLITDGRAELEDQIRAICSSYTDGHIFVLDVAASQKEMRRTGAVIGIFLYGFITLITLIGVTNIFNTISTNVALRRREFAMLKSMGLTPKGFNKIINYESIFYGLKALLYGLPVSILISLGIYNAFGNFFEFAFFLPWKEILICMGGVFVIVFMTMLHASGRLKHENIIEALKEENI